MEKKIVGKLTAFLLAAAVVISFMPLTAAPAKAAEEKEIKSASIAITAPAAGTKTSFAFDKEQGTMKVTNGPKVKVNTEGLTLNSDYAVWLDKPYMDFRTEDPTKSIFSGTFKANNYYYAMIALNVDEGYFFNPMELVPYADTPQSEKKIKLKKSDINISGGDLVWAYGTWDYSNGYRQMLVLLVEVKVPDKAAAAKPVVLAKVKPVKGGVKVSWKKVSGAEKYQVVMQKCTTQKVVKKKTVKGNVTSVTFKGLKKKNCYKIVVKAKKKSGGKYVEFAKSKKIHSSLKGTKKYTYPKKVTLNKTSISLQQGGKATVKGTVKKANKKKKLLSEKHVAKVRYFSTNKSVATVSKKGVITAKKPGSCRVYAMAVNGACKSVKVTVAAKPDPERYSVSYYDYEMPIPVYVERVNAGTTVTIPKVSMYGGEFALENWFDMANGDKYAAGDKLKVNKDYDFEGYSRILK